MTFFHLSHLLQKKLITITIIIGNSIDVYVINSFFYSTNCPSNLKLENSRSKKKTNKMKKHLPWDTNKW